MADGLERHLAAMDRRVSHGSRDGQETVVVHAGRTYPTHALDLWDAVTNPDRLRRWFMPITGDLRVGGRYQLQGNAGGTIEQCVEPELIRVTWEFGGGVSWLTVRFLPDAAGTRLELEHESPLMPGFTDRFGPGAVGVGWDLGFLGLALHLQDPGVERLLEAQESWALSPEALGLYRLSAQAWGRADAAAGTPEEAAMAAAETTRAFYSGELQPGGMGGNEAEPSGGGGNEAEPSGGGGDEAEPSGGGGDEAEPFGGGDGGE